MSFRERESDLIKTGAVLKVGNRDESVKKHEGQYAVVFFPPFFPAKTVECCRPKDGATSRLFLVFCDLVYSFFLLFF